MLGEVWVAIRRVGGRLQGSLGESMDDSGGHKVRQESQREAQRRPRGLKKEQNGGSEVPNAAKRRATGSQESAKATQVCNK